MKYDFKNAYFCSKAFTNLEALLEFSVHSVLNSMKKFHQTLQQ